VTKHAAGCDLPADPAALSASHPARQSFATVEAGTLCQACGACCAYSRTWPRFTTETDAELALIADDLVDDGLSGMRCYGDRCAALVGTIGTATTCLIYAARPHVCRACEPGDGACLTARARFGL
jgi:hypothetical protein